MSAAKNWMTTQTTDPEQSVAPLEDTTDAQVSADAEAQTQQQTEPEAVEDPRDRIARKARERRDAEFARMNETVVAHNDANDPDDDDPDDGKQTQTQTTQGAAQQAAPSDSGQGDSGKPKTYKVKVNHNEFEMDQVALLRAAEIDPSEADLYQPHHLVRLAQKNLAANELLEEAKAARKRAASRPADVDDDQGGEEVQQQQQAPEQRAVPGKDLVEALLFEDPEAAAQRLNEFVDSKIQSGLAQRQAAEKVLALESDIDAALFAAAAENPDIANDEIANTVAAKQIERLAEKEIRGKVPLTAEQIELFKKRGMITDVYRAALMDGVPGIRAPSDLIGEAVRETRTYLNRPAPHQGGGQRQEQQQQQPNGQNTRVEAKRGLIQQPQRTVQMLSLAGGQQQRQQPRSIEESRRAAIKNRVASQRSLLHG